MHIIPVLFGGLSIIIPTKPSGHYSKTFETSLQQNLKIISTQCKHPSTIWTSFQHLKIILAPFEYHSCSTTEHHSNTIWTPF